jgi:GntR family transcriptional regulator
MPHGGRCPARVGGTGIKGLIRGRHGSQTRGVLRQHNDATINGVMAPVDKRPRAVPDPYTPSPVDRTDTTPLHEQVAADIRRAIAEGEAGPGERIPQARDLAAVLGVNTNTVLRALRILRNEGLLELGRGRAIVVTGTPQRSDLVSKMRELIRLGRACGYRREELVAMLKSLPG